MDTSDEEVFLAKWVYQSFAMITAQTLGPAWRILPQAAKVSEVLRPAFEAIVAQETQPVPGRVWEVPSPWHAALYLSALQHHLAISGNRALFRGQSNSAWQITPSLGRPGVNPAEEEQKGQLFCRLLASLPFNRASIVHPFAASRLDLQISPKSYWAAAQHYGIRTDLIDFTTDPAVAVFFACSGRDPEPNQTSSVFVLPLELTLDRGGEIILPPPFVDRLYTQRGLFVRRDTAISESEFGLLEVRFPSSFRFAPFQVIRAGSGVVNVLRDSVPMQALLRIVDENPAPDEPHFNELSAALKEPFAGVSKDPLAMWAQYVDFFEDQLYWLAYKVEDASESLAVDLLQPIVSANRELASATAQFYRWAAKLPPDLSGYTEEKKAHLLKFAGLLTSLLG